MLPPCYAAELAQWETHAKENDFARRWLVPLPRTAPGRRAPRRAQTLPCCGNHPRFGALGCFRDVSKKSIAGLNSRWLCAADPRATTLKGDDRDRAFVASRGDTVVEAALTFDGEADLAAELVGAAAVGFRRCLEGGQNVVATHRARVLSEPALGFRCR